MSLKTFEIHENSGADGVVHLSIPTDRPDCRYRVVVSIEPEVATNPDHAKKDIRGWSEGFFERTYGKWHGEFERAPQGEYEIRESF